MLSLDQTLLWLASVASPIGEEHALCNQVQERLAKLPLDAPIRRYGDSIVVPWRRNRSGPHIALVGHLDTVRTENGRARIEGERIFGSGVADMKSGLALMIALAEGVGGELASNANLTLVFYAREEGPFDENELGPVLEADAELRGVDLAVCLEPSDNRLHLGCCGSIHAELTFIGRTGHSARPWEAKNAVLEAAGFLSELAAQVPEDSVIEGLTFRTVTSVTRANDGARGRNVIPDRFVLNLNHRFAPVYSIAEAKARLEAQVAGRGELRFTDLSPAAPPRREHPLVDALVAAGVKDVAPKQAWTDVARFALLGIPAINFGPGENAQAHQKNESTALPLVHEGYAIFRRWLGAL